MNKELIKKYKAEFDYYLDNGKVLLGYNTGDGYKWSELIDGDWNYCLSKHKIVIDDDYVEFRKALIEGKTIQILDRCIQQGCNNKWFIQVRPDFSHPVEYYRIKPNKPKFKVGDKVLVTSNSDTWEDEIVKIDNNSYHFKSKGHLRIDRQDEQLKALPKFKIGDWVLVYYSNGKENNLFNVKRIKYVTDEAIEYHNDTGVTYFKNEHQVELWKPKPGEWCWFWDEGSISAPVLRQVNTENFSIHQVDFTNLEPFIGQLPSHLKDNQ